MLNKIPNRKILEFLGFQTPGKANLSQACRDPWVDTALHLVPTFCVGVFEIDSYSLSEVFLLQVRVD